jgi:hypothetical protein
MRRRRIFEASASLALRGIPGLKMRVEANAAPFQGAL